MSNLTEEQVQEVNQSIQTLNLALEKANLKGVYTLQESSLIYNCICKVLNFTNTIKKMGEVEKDIEKTEETSSK